MLRLLGAIIKGAFFLPLLTIVLAFIGTIAYSFVDNSGMVSTLGTNSLPVLHWQNTGTLIGGGLGALIGLYVWIRLIARAQEINELKQSGRRIVATIVDIKKHVHQTSSYQGQHLRTNIHYTYTIIATWVDPTTRITHRFESEHLNSRPSRFRTNDGIHVLVDRHNFKKYYVETNR